MRALKEILNVILDLPKEAINALRNKLAPTNECEADITSSTPAGAVFMGMELLDRLELPAIIDAAIGEMHTPLEELRKNVDKASEEMGKPSTGTILSLLVADMLAKPKEVMRIYKVEEITKKWNLFKIFGIEEKKLNDDKILRCMSKLGRECGIINEILLKLSLGVNEKFGVPLERFFLDSTVTELDGEFKKADKVCFGRGSDLSKQLITSMIASSGSKIPVGGFVYSGNTNDATTLPDAIKVIDRIAKEDKSETKELVVDRIYLTAKNIVAMRNSPNVKIKWLGPLKSGLSEERFRELIDEAYEKGLWTDISYRSPKEISQNQKPALKAFETAWTMTDEIKPELKTGQKRRAKGSIQKIQVEMRCVAYTDENRAADEKKSRDKRKVKIDKKIGEFQG
jgi:transposase